MGLAVGPDDEAELWQRFLLQRAEADREALISRHTGFARAMAARLYSDRQISEIEFDEFLQYAMVGLIEAVDRYDPRRGAGFRTFSMARIRGAMLDGIEKFNEKQQQIASYARGRDERFQSLLQEAATLEQDPFLRLVDMTIGAAIGYMLEGAQLYQEEEGTYEHNVYRSRELRDLSRCLTDLLGSLPETEQTVIRGHYFHQQRFDQIAENLGLSKGRISQLHHRALRRLRDHYDQLQLLRTDY